MGDLNNPDTRQAVLRERLKAGASLLAAALAEELGASVHTIRRDLIALEREGLVRRVRGGAMPLVGPAPSYRARADQPAKAVVLLAMRTVDLMLNDGPIFVDAGTTMNAVASRLPRGFRGLIATPAPSVALAALARGAHVHLIGGPPLPLGRDGDRQRR
jgi:DeoR/GlpR family transcriptional regulator of sugar metabolism